jgi:acetoin utilization protein AcuB
MNLLAKISTIMTADPITVSIDDSLKVVEQIFKSKRIHHIPVEKDGILLGIISKSDYLFFKRGFSNDSLNKDIEDVRLTSYRAEDIMTKGIAKMEADERINVALEIFKENLFHAIPIVDGEKLVGIVTTYDIIKNLAEDTKVISEYSNS